jgi:oxygen-independent coproporphyrinogen-3 oxidase
MHLYIHLPFCRSRCIYCDFVVVLEKYGGQAAYVHALLTELRAKLPPGGRFETVYFGGGTPSLLPAPEIGRLLQAVPLAPGAEIILEANPKAMADPPGAYLAVGVNRVSIGVQSLNDPELTKLSRGHTAQDAADLVQDFQAAGCRNISIDLMYGIPTQTQTSWANTLQAATALNTQHISFYGLKVEEGTPLATLTAKTQAYPLPEDAETVDMYFQGLAVLGQAGFQRYEFSNLAQPGFESRHNLNTWRNGEYIGVGAGAHGYWHGMRTENPRDVAAYVADPLGSAQLTPCPVQEQRENALIFGLRLREGVDIAHWQAAYGVDFDAQFGSVLARYPEFFAWRGSRLCLTEAAIPVSNTLLCEFLATE